MALTEQEIEKIIVRYIISFQQIGNERIEKNLFPTEVYKPKVV